MSTFNKLVLMKANAAIAAGDNEGFLAYCTEYITWTFVGEQTLHGKQAVREWIKENYKESPSFTVKSTIGDEDMVEAIGEIMSTNAHGMKEKNQYCDVWRFENGKLAELHAYVIKVG